MRREICLGEAARPYFQVAQEHLRTARRFCEPVNCPDLQHYLIWLDAQATTYSERLASNAATLLNDAVRRLFGPVVSSDAERPNSKKEGLLK